MKLSEGSKRFFLIVMLAIVIVVGSVLIFFMDDGTDQEILDQALMPAPTSETYYMEKLIYEERNIHEPIVSNFVCYKGNVAKIAFTKMNESKLMSISEMEDILDVPGEVLQGNSYCVDDDCNFLIVYYDADNQNVVYETIDLQGNTVKGPVVLQDFAGSTNDNSYIQVEQLRVDRKYIYLLSKTDTNPILQVFYRNGELHSSYPIIDSFDIDEQGNLYIAFTISEEHEINGFKKINPETGESYYEAQLKNAPKFIRYSREEDMIYVMDDEGIDTFNAKNGRKIERVFTFGEDSTFMGDTYFLVDFAVDAERKLYLSGFYFDDTKGDNGELINLYYQYELTDGVKAEKPATLRITAAYRHDFLDEAIKRYELKYPEQKIRYDYRFNSRNEYLDNREQYGQQFTLDVLTGEVGDIVMTGGGGVSSFDLFKTDAFIDLTSYIKADKNYEHLNKNALEGIKIDGAVRGLPISIVYSFYEVNIPLAERIGFNFKRNQHSWSEIISLTKVIEEKAPKSYLLIDSGEQGYPLLDMLVSNMPQLIDLEKKEVNLRHDWFLQLLQDFKEAYNTKHFLQKEYQFDKIDSLHESLIIQKDTFEFSYRDMIYRYLEYNQLENKQSLYMPTFTGERSNNRIAYSNNMYSISSNSPNKEQAWHFLSFLLEEEIQMLHTLPGKPINARANEKLLMNAAQEVKNIYGDEVFKFVHMMTPLSNEIDYLYDMGYFKLDLYHPIFEYVEGKISLEEALQQAEKNVWIRLHE